MRKLFPYVLLITDYKVIHRVIHRVIHKLSTMSNAQNVGVERVCGSKKSYPQFLGIFFSTEGESIK